MKAFLLLPASVALGVDRDPLRGDTRSVHRLDDGGQSNVV
jgi:hypothetical protein